MRNSQNFWDKNAGRYDRFMRKDAAAYERLFELLRPVVRHKTVLELATGTGVIAKNIVNSAAHIEATDASPEMIAEAKRDNRSAKLHFSVQDMFHLPYADGSFDVIIVAHHAADFGDACAPVLQQKLRSAAHPVVHQPCAYGSAVGRAEAGLHGRQRQANRRDSSSCVWFSERCSARKSRMACTFSTCVR